MSEVDFLKLPFDTNIAYVASGDKVTYVNKQTKKCIVVENEWSSLMDVFPRDFGRITRLTPQSSYKVLGWILNPNCKIPHIINVDNCTLIHYAVFINNTNHIKALLKAGAQLDIKASYEIVSYDPSYTEIIKQFTPLELAEFLDHKDAVELLNKALSVKNTDPLLGLGSANQGFFYRNIDKKENNLPIVQDFEI